MTEFSGLWTTGGSTGDQQTSYTQAQLSTCFDILACCSRFEGVAPTYLNELAPSDGGANTCDVASGGAIVDGKYYDNSATVNVNIPSAVGGGNTRIDRIVVRCTWATYQARIYRIAGTDAAEPTVPAITQTPGSTYDIKIAQVLVDTAGDVTVTDERDWATHDVDDSTIERNITNGQLRVKDSGIVAAKIGTGAVTETKIGTGAVTNTKLGADSVTNAKIGDDQIDSEHYVDGSIDLAHLSADCVDDTKVGNRVPQFYRRQGGSSTVWTTQGTTTYTPTTVRMQAGAINTTTISSNGYDAVGITFPTAFSYAPVVFATTSDGTDPLYGGDSSTVVVYSITTTGCTFKVINNQTQSAAYTVYWLAIGPE